MDRGTGGCLAPAALDALRPREAGLGATQPGWPLVRSAPRVLAGEEAHGSVVHGPWACLWGWAYPCQMVSFHLPAARRPSDCPEPKRMGTEGLSLSLTAPTFEGIFCGKHWLYRPWAPKPHSAVSRLCH